MLKIEKFQIFSTLVLFTSIVQTQVLNRCPNNNVDWWKTSIRLPAQLVTSNQTIQFKIQPECWEAGSDCEWKCASGKLHTIKIHIRDIVYEDENLTEIKFTPDGVLKLDKQYFFPFDYCIQEFFGASLKLQICVPDCGKSKFCLPKCCSMNKILDVGSGTCKFTSHKWTPLVYTEKNLDSQVCGEILPEENFHIYQSPPTCAEFQSFFLKQTDDHTTARVRFGLRKDGTVVMKKLQDSSWITLEPGEFCLDGVQNFDGIRTHYDGDPLDQLLIACPATGEEKTTSLNLTGILYVILLFAGTPFLFLTVVVLGILFKQQNIHGRTLFAHSLAMFVNYVGQGVTNAVTRIFTSEDSYSTICRLIGIANHYFILASFCWLSVINFDLWRMFRNLQVRKDHSRGMKKFFQYCAFACGLPLLAVITGIVLDKKFGHFGDEFLCQDFVTVPLYGYKTCFMVEEARDYYLYAPVLSLMVINVIFIVLTLVNINGHRKSTKVALAQKSSKQSTKFSVLSKLFIVTGFAWGSEVFVWKLKEENETLPWYLVFPDLLSVIQAIAIFYLFICKRKIFVQLQTTVPLLRPSLDKVLQWKIFQEPKIQTTSFVMKQGNVQLNPMVKEVES